MKSSLRITLLLATLLGAFFDATEADARILLKNICRVKGQEENTLQGMGIVIGLKGTGDGGNSLPTMRSLMTALRLMGNPVDKIVELKDSKNVALVMVTATVPAAGARQGDKLDCTVSSIGGAKSLAGGVLFLTPLQGPQVNNPRIYALAQGPLQIDDPKQPLSAKIHQGCRLEEDFFNAFTKDNKVTLVLDKNRADFQVAQDIADLINGQLYQANDGNLARALSAINIEVRIPPASRDEPVAFIAQLMSLPILDPQTDARVVINPKTGSIVISGDIEIGPVVVTHKNIVIETAGAPPVATGGFIPVDPTKGSASKLKSLVEALNAVKVPKEDMIDIIQGLERDGKLHGTLVIE